MLADNQVEDSKSFKPNRLQQLAMIGMLFMVVLSFALANLQSILWISSDWLVSTVLPAVVTDATNQARASEQLAPLARSTALDQAAQMKADDMAKYGYFAHWSPDGISPWHWFEVAGYKYQHAGENLAVHFTDSEAVVDAWLNSPTHRANIMNGNYTEIGIGTAQGNYENYDTVFVVQMFGTPAKATPVAATVSEPEVPVVDTSTDEVSEVASEDVAIDSDEVATNVDVTDAGTVVYESFASTEDQSQGEVLAEHDTGEVLHDTASFWGRVATSPRLVLQIAYAFIGLIIFGLIMVSLVWEWRRRHPVQMIYSAGLLTVMTLLLLLHTVITGGVLIA